MGGEVEEPLGLDFQVDSGSISFGRFDNETLCWERRSTFSHSRYLEEVEKCSKPGLVTEKKAYFEAHFRKKGFLSPTSLICLNGTCYETTGNDTWPNGEEIYCSNASTHSAQFDQIMDGSNHQQASYEPQLECTNDGEYIPKVDADAVDDATSFSKNSTKSVIEVEHDRERANRETSHGSRVATGMSPQNYANQKTSRGILKDQPSSGRQENVLSKLDNMNPRVVPRSRVRESKTSPTSKGAENNNNRKVRNVPVRSITEKKTSGYPDTCRVNKTTKYKSDSKSKRDADTNRTGKESRNGNFLEPQSSISHKVSSRVHQNKNSLPRSKVTTTVTNPGVRPNISRSGFKCDEHARRINVGNNESKNLDAKSSTRLSKSASVASLVKGDPPKTSGISRCQLTSRSVIGNGKNGISVEKEVEKEKS